MDQFMTRGDRDLVERYTEKLSEKGACHVAMKTELVELLQMQEQARSREHLGHKLVRSISRTFVVPQNSSAEERAEHIVGLARVRRRMKLVDNPEGEGARSKWKQFFTRRKRKAVLACFLAVPYFDISKHRAINLFLETYSQQWLESSEDHTSSALGHELLDHQDYLVTHKTASLPPHHRDPLTQLFTMIKRKATTGECLDHELFIAYPNVLSKIITGVRNDERITGEENVTVAYQSYYKRRTELYARQNQLARRGAASTVLLVITASRGSNSDVIHSILRLGIALLEEGNHLVQEEMLAQLQAMDVGFLSSVARLVASCSVLDWNAYQRYQRTEVMQSTSCLAMSKVLCGSEVTEDLFRFLQLLCEGHNADFQNYLRTQAGNTTTVNIITCTVDYLLRLQESVSDFYWHYSGQETIDLLGRDSLLRAFRVAKQVFRTLTEYIQGPCVPNQETLARSRLLDAVSGFLQVFAVLQRKLYRDTSQVELLRELLGLQEEMFILLLSMLEGSAMSSQLGRLMVDMLVESEQWVQDIMAFFSIFIKLKDSTTSKAFKEYDLNKDGMISYREFELAMQSQQRYTKEEIAYLMECADTNNDGLLDYTEFTERFHQPAENIGFHLCVLIVHLSEHLPQEKRLAQFKTSCQGRELMEHFEQGMGCIEIQGKSGRIERVYFEVKQSRLAQWNETQIKESRKNFLHSVDMRSHKKKLEGFVSFCEDTIFEMDYADKISGSEQRSRESRAFQHRLRHTKALQSPARSRPILRRVVEVVRGMWRRHRPLDTLKTVVLAVWTLFVLILLIPLLNFLKRAGSKLGTALSRRLAVADHSHSPDRSSTHPPQTSGSRLGTLAQRKALRLSITRDQSQTTPPANAQQVPATTSTQTTEENGSQQTQTQNGTQGEHPAASGQATLTKRLKSLLPHQIQTPRSSNTPLISATLHQLNLRYNRSHMRHPSPSPTSPLPTQQGDQSLTPGMAEDTYVPKITLSTRSWQAFIARHYYRLNSVKLLVTFLINVALLSFTVQSLSQEQSAVSGDTCEANSSLHTSAASLCSETVELIWNPLYLKLLSLFHFLLSLLLILSYWNLKVPLIIFKREKEIARRLETKHTWLGSRPGWSPGIGNVWEWGMADWWAWLCDMWDSTVISAPSFPRNYWDKQVKDRVRSQFEGASRDLVTRQLGMGTQCPFETRSKWGNVSATVNSLGDLRYFVWMVGTVLSDMLSIFDPNLYMVLYHIFYCGLSFLGLRSNSFYFSIHLLDLVMNFKLLRTVLYSVLHNGKQLLMTVLMTCVVIYLYTVIAFNYFRKFYVQQSHTNGEPVYACDNMAKCFIYHIDKGLRAGGGIGDVLKSASGEPDEILRLLFDVTFFFFVIVILLAIIQGLIIDAFGELRDKEDSITSDMKNKCFVCGLPKTEFDHVAHGFDNHITRDHNAANYMFFLQYLIRKQESEFSGQESYVWEMYLKRRWDFFPVGDSFRGQEERRQLSGPEGVASSRNKTKRPFSPLLMQSNYTSPSVVTATQSL
ncbi:Ryanodine receptor 2 [Geodia barretti]|uniref:Ryanodine receptor 2 n=1 Tax=Geodia barretti TaxID=519541 RepID=A0AA35X1K6_GEOBA|nr:Ryanodine receptor 2 [Geodia barretti]